MKIRSLLKKLLKDTRKLEDIFDTAIVGSVIYNPIYGSNATDGISSEEEANAFRNAEPLKNILIKDISLYE